MIEPIRGKVAIKQLDPEEMTSGGVILPDISQEGISLWLCIIAPYLYIHA